MTLRRIVSGGQTGVDLAALDSARKCMVYEWGGFCPKGRLYEDGQIPDEYFPATGKSGLQEAESSRYAQRTALNVRHSDATLILKHGVMTRGTKLTVTVCRRRQKYYQIVDPYKTYHTLRAVKFIVEQKVEVLNVAGPRESSRPGIYEVARIFLTSVWNYVFAYQRWGIKIWDPKKTKGNI